MKAFVVVVTDEASCPTANFLKQWMMVPCEVHELPSAEELGRAALDAFDPDGCEYKQIGRAILKALGVEQ